MRNHFEQKIQQKAKAVASKIFDVNVKTSASFWRHSSTDEREDHNKEEDKEEETAFTLDQPT